MKESVMDVKVTGAGVQESKPVSEKENVEKVEKVDLGPTFDPNIFTHPGGHPKQWVIIRDTGQPHEKKQPFVSLNGYAYQFQKNVPIQLPTPVLNMMRNCVYTKTERDEDTGEESTRNIPRFSIEVLPNAPNGTN
jgi:hypothetical protein